MYRSVLRVHASIFPTTRNIGWFTRSYGRSFPVATGSDVIQRFVRCSHPLYSGESGTSRKNSHLSTTTFQALEGVSKESKRAIEEDLKFSHLSVVQERTLPKIMQGKDVIAKAKTGTGKTIAFLLPIIEKIAKSRKLSRSQISALIISPTRELAYQIADDAKKLVLYHDISVGCFVGGTNVNVDHTRLRRPLDILVGTPGRINALLNEGMDRNVRELTSLVLDEGDRLLDGGFQHELDKIFSFLPKSRQTIIFSATIPKSLASFNEKVLHHEHEYINTVSDEDEQTNSHVTQLSVICPLRQQIKVIDHFLHEHIKDMTEKKEYFKVIVFLNTARATGIMAQIFEKSSLNVVEMHSRKSQGYRKAASETFEKSFDVVMFSSDVSARGMDYSDVSLVIQVGYTDRESYIHRLGRTGRAGREGKGIIIASPFEIPLIKDLSSQLPIVPVPQQLVKDICGAEMRPALQNAFFSIPTNSDLSESAARAHSAFLGFYNGIQKKLSLSPEELVDHSYEFAKSIGLKKMPLVDARIARKMGMSHVRNLLINNSPKTKKPSNNPKQNSVFWKKNRTK